jgi:ABC-type glycerol-3-phosphate transport system substrate-binding protein
MSNFKIVIIGIFGAGIIFGMLVFSGVISFGSSAATKEVTGSVTIWGTFDQNAMAGFISDFDTRNQKVTATYVQKDAATFDATLTEAIASGSAPDLILLPDSLVWRYSDKISHIPFASLPAQTFQSTFISAGNIFSATDGYVAVPWAADPLVMYYNRDMIEGIGLSQPPSNWQAFVASVPLLAKKQADLTLTQQAAALGSYSNIAHASDILALLFFENGNPFITLGATRPNIHFGTTSTADEITTSSQALTFYMGFSNSTNQDYTWNSGQPLDRSAFLSSTLAYYFGLASELPLIRATNPNLNFGIALPPQAAGKSPVTSGHVYGFAIPKSAPNQILSFTAATLLSNTASEAAITSKTGTSLALIPARRDVLAVKPVNDAYLWLLYDAAMSSGIWKALVGDISSSTLPVGDALTKAAAQLSSLGAKI